MQATSHTVTEGEVVNFSQEIEFQTNNINSRPSTKGNTDYSTRHMLKHKSSYQSDFDEDSDDQEKSEASAFYELDF